MLKAALLSLLSFGFVSQASAAVYMQYTDTDGFGMADIEADSVGPTAFVDIFFDGNDALVGGINGFSLSIVDTLEIASMSVFGSAAPFVFAISPATPTKIDYGFLGGLTQSGKLMTVQINLGNVGSFPDDELADLILGGSSISGATPQLVVDPITGQNTQEANYDIQIPAVPVPAAGWLMFGALSLLGVSQMRRQA